jgi:hypothetical protein
LQHRGSIKDLLFMVLLELLVSDIPKGFSFKGLHLVHIFMLASLRMEFIVPGANFFSVVSLNLSWKTEYFSNILEALCLVMELCINSHI